MLSLTNIFIIQWSRMIIVSAWWHFRTVSAWCHGLTNILWSLNVMASLWTLYVMTSWIYFPPSPQSNRCIYADLPPSQKFWPPPHITVRPVERDWRCYHSPLAHLRLHHYFHPWCCPSEVLVPFPPLFYQGPSWDPQSPPSLDVLFLDGYMTSLLILM